MRRRARVCWSLSLLAAVACAGGSHRQSTEGGNVIKRSELEAAGSVTTYDAVQRLRPNFLRDRGPVSIVNAGARARPAVFIDQTEYGELESLRTLPASRVEEVRFYGGAEAVTKFGSAYGAGVILLTMRVQ